MGVRDSKDGRERPVVLVTGGAGFVGAGAVRALLADGASVLVVDDLSTGRLDRLPTDEPDLEVHVGDAAEPGRLAALCGARDVDAVLHLASVVGVRRVLKDPAATRAGILRLTKAVLRELGALPASVRPRLFAASTSEVYADSLARMAEDHPLREQGEAGRWAYAAAKKESEVRFDAAGLWAAGEGPVHLRLFNVVGPGQDASGGMVLPRFVEQLRDGRPLSVYGDGSATRTYAHVEAVGADLARLCRMSAPPPGPLNLGGTATASSLGLAREVCRAAGLREARIEHVDVRAVLPGYREIPRRVPDLTRARGLELVRAPWSLEAIVADTLARHPVAAASRGATPCASPAS